VAHAGFAHVTEVADESAPLTAEEEDVLGKLKAHIGEAGLELLTHEALLRFVRGYAFEAKTGGKDKWVQVACAEADKTVKWRKEIDANTLERRSLPLWEDFSTCWPTGVYGTDNQGHALIVERYKDFKLEKLVGLFKPDDLTVYQARNMEYVQRRKAKVSDRIGRIVYKHVYILDGGGLGMGVLNWRQHMQAVLQVAQYYYPETLYRLCIVNTPVMFRMVWSALSPLIHPITRAKIQVIAGKGLKELAALGIDANQIPPSIGGTWQPDPEFEAELAQDLAAAKEPSPPVAVADES